MSISSPSACMSHTIKNTNRHLRRSDWFTVFYVTRTTLKAAAGHYLVRAQRLSSRLVGPLGVGWGWNACWRAAMPMSSLGSLHNENLAAPLWKIYAQCVGRCGWTYHPGRCRKIWSSRIRRCWRQWWVLWGSIEPFVPFAACLWETQETCGSCCFARSGTIRWRTWTPSRSCTGIDDFGLPRESWKKVEGAGTTASIWRNRCHTFLHVKIRAGNLFMWKVFNCVVLGGPCQQCILLSKTEKGEGV